MHSPFVTSSTERKEDLRWVITGEALQTGGEALQEGGGLQYLSPTTLLIFTSRVSVSDSPSHPIAGTSYSGSSYTGLLGGSDTLEAELAGGGASSESCLLTGGAGGGTLGRVSVLDRRLRLGFLRLSMYEHGAQPSFSPICTYHQPPGFFSITYNTQHGN